MSQPRDPTFKHPDLPHDADEDEWPMGIDPSGKLRVVDEERDEEEGEKEEGED